MFPEPKLVKGCIGLLLVAAGFGCERLGRVFPASYIVGALEGTSFRSWRKYSHAATGLALEFHDFLKA